jgi:hypothetical protein
MLDLNLGPFWYQAAVRPTTPCNFCVKGFLVNIYFACDNFTMCLLMN